MKILAIVGSPRKKGNTFRIVEKVKEYLAMEDENLDFDYLFLQDCHLETCRGCFTCIARGEELCSLKDDRDRILEQMMAADGIIYAEPCYAMGVPGLMKNFIDRFAYTLHRPCFFGKVFLAVSTVGGVVGLKQTLQQLSVPTGGGRLAGKIGVACSPVPIPWLERKGERSVRKGSAAFHRMLLTPPQVSPGYGQPCLFPFIQTIHDVCVLPEGQSCG